MTIASARDYSAAARRILPHMVFEYIEGGSYAEHTLARNEEDFKLFELRQRVLQDATHLVTQKRLFGQDMPLPLMLAPVGMAGMYRRRGEVLAARAAESAGLPFCLSTLSVCGLPEVASSVRTAPWFQLYMIKDRGKMKDMLDQAIELGVPGLMFTVDLAVPGARYRDARSGFSAQPSLSQHARRLYEGITHPRWTWDVFLRGRPHSFGNLSNVADRAGDGFGSFWSWIRANFDPSATWRDVEWIRSNWNGPIVFKGILDPDDARSALAVGADGIVVSNHGGRQLDGVPSTIRALEPVVQAVAGAVPVLVDGGIRSGLDILKALALGADACLIGRLWAYALSVDGEAGVARMLQILREELLVGMALTGCTDLSRADRTLLARVSSTPDRSGAVGRR